MPKDIEDALLFTQFADARYRQVGLMPATYLRASLAAGYTQKQGFYGDLSQADAEKALGAAVRTACVQPLTVFHFGLLPAALACTFVLFPSLTALIWTQGCDCRHLRIAAGPPTILSGVSHTPVRKTVHFSCWQIISRPVVLGISLRPMRPLCRAKGGKIVHLKIFQVESGAVLEGDAVFRGTLQELLTYYHAVDVKPGFGKLKQPYDKLIVPSAPAAASPPPPASPGPRARTASTSSVTSPSATSSTTLLLPVDETPSVQQQLSDIEVRMEVIYTSATDGKYTPAQVRVGPTAFDERV